MWLKVLYFNSCSMFNNKVLVVTSLVLVVGLWFYWFALRPVNIRKECSLIKGVKSLTQKDSTNTTIYDTSSTFLERYNSFMADTCETNNAKIRATYNLPNNAIPSNECWREATQEQYTNCIHRNGISN